MPAPHPMRLDVTDLRAFYASPLGIVTHRTVARTIHGFLGSVSGLRVLGIGYVTPYLGRSTSSPSARSPSCRRRRGW